MITQKVFDENLVGILGKTPLRVAVAVSGGSDSLCLTLLTNNWCKENGVELTALTVDHNLRSESAEEAMTVHSWLENYGIHHEILTYTGKIPTSNIEAEARQYRYKLLCDYVKQHNIDFLFIAHNQDEQRETFFLNLSRGSGVYGLCGMPAISQRDGVNIVRPMMIFTKSEIKEYLTNIHQVWVEDPSNQDDKYKRVRIRKLQSFIDELELTNERIVNTISNMQRVRDSIEFFVRECISKVIEKQEDKIIVNTNSLLYYPEEIVIRTLAKIIRENSNKLYPPRLENLELLYKKIKLGSLNKGITLSNMKISFNKDKNIVFQRETGRNQKKPLKKTKI